MSWSSRDGKEGPVLNLSQVKTGGTHPIVGMVEGLVTQKGLESGWAKLSGSDAAAEAAKKAAEEVARKKALAAAAGKAASTTATANSAINSTNTAAMLA